MTAAATVKPPGAGWGEAPLDAAPGKPAGRDAAIPVAGGVGAAAGAERPGLEAAVAGTATDWGWARPAARP
ncbi:MAG: hypothetical protein M0Z30_18515, partial [Actinomycetota bacterium]|nr:hypothetical protein [Actinomycetota bacterium]